MTTISTAFDSHTRELDDSISDLVRESMSHPAIEHPFLQRMAACNFRDNFAALRAYAVEYSGYAQWFPRYLRRVISRLDREEHRELLSHNLAEEQGQLGEDDREELRKVGIHPDTVQGIPHPKLFRRFTDAMGIRDDELAQPTPAAARWRTRFLHFLEQATPAQAVGALGLGTEQIVKPVYKKLLRAIIGTGVLRRSDFVFFELHCIVDDQHQQDLLEIARELASEPNGVAELRSGMRTALHMRHEFWDALYRNILDSQLANPA